MDPTDSSPEFIDELAENCRQFVNLSLGVELDYTAETLPVLDHYLEQAREDIAARPELLPLISRAAGAYFGRVFEEILGGFWIAPSQDDRGWFVCTRSCFLAINPVGVAFDALLLSSDHAGPSSRLQVAPEDRQLIVQRLEDLPEVDECDYYLLSTRLEVLELAVDTLREHMRQGGQSDVEFGAEDYESLSSES
jgi:hypothetical protein